MKTIWIVFRKEMIDTLRDRRTLMFMIVIPLLVFPVLFNVMFSLQKSSREKARAKTLRVALVDSGTNGRLRQLIHDHDDITLVAGVHADSVRTLVGRDSLDGAYVVAEDFAEKLAANRAGRIDLYYKSTDDTRVIHGRLEAIIAAYDDEILKERLNRLGLPEDIGTGVDERTHNVASMKEQIGKQVGGFLPYLFILFCFMGTMYPAIDLGAGEKERGTLETLLTAPVNRFHILVGKLGVITLSGLVSATVSMVGLYIGVRRVAEIPPEFLDVIVKILGWETITLVLSLIIPLAVFFAGILLSVSLTARSFKEAQSLISPLNIAVIVPAAVGMLPGVNMSYATALIPVLNVSLATKEVIAGTIQTGHLLTVYASLIGFAILGLYLASQWFRRESIIFRS